MALCLKNNQSLVFIFITVMIDIMGLGIIIPVIPKLIEELTGGTLSEASTYGGFLIFSYAITQFFFAPVIGNLSDQYGRKKVLLIALFAYAIDYLIMGFATSIIWLFIGRVIAGVTGASASVATAYIADVSTEKNKAQNFGLLGAAFGLGFIIGPMLGGIIGHYGSRYPFYAAALLSFVNCIYGLLVVPESLKPENRRPFSWKNANPVGSFKFIQRYPHLKLLMLCIFLVNIASHAMQSTWTYIGMERYQWNERTVGLSLGFVGLLTAIVQAGLLRLIIPKLGMQKSILTGLLFQVITYPLMGFSSQGWMLFLCIIPFSLSGITGPAIQGYISNETPNNEQGQIQGFITSIVSLTAIIGPLLMTNLFSYFTKSNAPVYLPGSPFFMGGILSIMALILAYKFFKSN